MLFKLHSNEPLALVAYMKSHLKLIPPDCSFFTEEGNEIAVHKELFCQTKMMQGLVKSVACCCNKVEIIFPSVPIQELDLMVEFLYTGKFSCNQQYLAARVISNLQECLGFSKFIDVSEVQSVKEDTSMDIDSPSNGQSSGNIHKKIVV